MKQLDTSTKKKHVNKSTQPEEFESINVTTNCNKESDKHKEASSEYDINSKEKTPIMSEKKENNVLVMFRIYECGKYVLYSNYERACVEKYRTISKMKEIVDIFYSEIKEIRPTSRDMQNYIDICHKEPEMCVEYP